MAFDLNQYISGGLKLQDEGPESIRQVIQAIDSASGIPGQNRLREFADTARQRLDLFDDIQQQIAAGTAQDSTVVSASGARQVTPQEQADRFLREAREWITGMAQPTKRGRFLERYRETTDSLISDIANEQSNIQNILAGVGTGQLSAAEEARLQEQASRRQADLQSKIDQANALGLTVPESVLIDGNYIPAEGAASVLGQDAGISQTASAQRGLQASNIRQEADGTYSIVSRDGEVFEGGFSDLRSALGRQTEFVSGGTPGVSQVGERPLTPDEFRDARTRLGVSEANFDQYFRREGENIFLRADAFDEPGAFRAEGPTDLSADTLELNTTDSFVDSLQGSASAGMSSPDAFVGSIETIFDQIFAGTMSPRQLELQAQVDAGVGRVGEIVGELGQRRERAQEIQEGLKISEMTNELNDLQLKMTQKLAAYRGLNESLGDQAIPQPLIVGQRAALQRQQAVELGNLAMVATAIQGNIETAQSIANQMLDLEFGGLQAELNNTMALLDLQQGQLSKEEARQASRIEFIMGERQRILNEQRADREASYDLLMRMAEIGADTSVIDPNRSFEENLQSVAPVISQMAQLDGLMVDAAPAGLTAAEQAALDGARDKIDLIDDLMGHPGLSGSVGAGLLARWTPFRIDKADKADFFAGVQRLISQDTLQTLINLKQAGGTLGALSDQERLMLERAASKLGSWMKLDRNGNPTGKLVVSEEIFLQELSRLREVAQRAITAASAPADDIDIFLETVQGSADSFLDSAAGFNGDLSTSQNGSVPSLGTEVMGLGGITAYGSPLWSAGLDVDLRIGDPVRSPVAGTVEFVGVNGGFGNQVRIRTASGNSVWLSHLDAANVRPGQTIQSGAVIGTGGNSGSVIPMGGGDGSHLDLTVQRPDGTFMAPQEIARRVQRLNFS